LTTLRGVSVASLGPVLSMARRRVVGAMTSRPIDAMPAPAGDAVVARLLPALRRALDGTGPALLPLPAGPPAAIERVIAALHPGAPLEADDIALVLTTSGSPAHPRECSSPPTRCSPPRGRRSTASAVRAPGSSPCR
jgi:hypothetical protein